MHLCQFMLVSTERDGRGGERVVEEVSHGLDESVLELMRQVCKMCAIFLTDDEAYGRWITNSWSPQPPHGPHNDHMASTIAFNT